MSLQSNRTRGTSEQQPIQITGLSSIIFYVTSALPVNVTSLGLIGEFVLCEPIPLKIEPSPYHMPCLSDF